MVFAEMEIPVVLPINSDMLQVSITIIIHFSRLSNSHLGGASTLSVFVMKFVLHASQIVLMRE